MIQRAGSFHDPWWQIHFCVFLWGFTAILGKLITLPALPLVWWRMGLVTLSLLLLPRVWRSLRQFPPRLLLAYAGIGMLVALHWLTFYGAIKLSNASVGATCMALATVFTAMAEPLITRRAFAAGEVLLGLAVVPGVILVVGGIPGEMLAGVLLGAFSALMVAFFGSLNKRLAGTGDALAVTALELGAGTLLLTAIAPWLPGWFPELAGELFVLPAGKDLLWLLVLAWVCTLFPFALALVALRKISAFSAQQAVNMEPVYAIILAILLLDEQRELDLQFYIGVLIILLAVFTAPLLEKNRRRLLKAEVADTAEPR